MAAHPPLISVVIPSLNQGVYLDECLTSIADQGYPNVQVIIIDGGSSDTTLDVIATHESAITHWESGTDRGQSHALNKGFALATGDIVCWQNADDFYLPNAFHRVIQAFQGSPEAALVYGDWIEVDAEGNLLTEWQAFPFSLRSIKYGGTNAIAQAMFWSRAVHERIGQIPEHLHQVMDHYLTFRIGLNEGFDRFVPVHQTLTAFRRHEAQKTGNSASSAVASELQQMDLALELDRRGGLAGSSLRFGYKALRAARYLRQFGLSYLIDRMRSVAPRHPHKKISEP